MINRILLVPGWASHGWGHAESSTNLEQQVTGILNAVLNKAAVAPSGEGAAEYAESAIKAAVDAFKVRLTSARPRPLLLHSSKRAAGYTAF